MALRWGDEGVRPNAGGAQYAKPQRMFCRGRYGWLRYLAQAHMRQFQRAYEGLERTRNIRIMATGEGEVRVVPICSSPPNALHTHGDVRTEPEMMESNQTCNRSFLEFS